MGGALGTKLGAAFPVWRVSTVVFSVFEQACLMLCCQLWVYERNACSKIHKNQMDFKKNVVLNTFMLIISLQNVIYASPVLQGGRSSTPPKEFRKIINV